MLSINCPSIRQLERCLPHVLLSSGLLSLEKHFFFSSGAHDLQSPIKTQLPRLGNLSRPKQPGVATATERYGNTLTTSSLFRLARRLAQSSVPDHNRDTNSSLPGCQQHVFQSVLAPLLSSWLRLTSQAPRTLMSNASRLSLLCS